MYNRYVPQPDGSFQRNRMQEQGHPKPPPPPPPPCDPPPPPRPPQSTGILDHFKRLGHLRKENDALRLGDIRFFAAGDKHLGFTRSYNGKTLKVYINRSADTWDIPSGKILLGYNLQLVAPDWLTVGPRGFVLIEE